MWNNFGDITKKLAEKAAAAAENIEGQLNESVGASAETLAEMSQKKRMNGIGAAIDAKNAALDTMEDIDEDPFGEDDGFYDDEDSFDIGMHDENEDNNENIKKDEDIGFEKTIQMEKQDNDLPVPFAETNEAVVEEDVVNDLSVRGKKGISSKGLELKNDEGNQNVGEIQEEGLYDDDDSGDDDEEEVDFDNFEKPPQQQDKSDSIGPVEIPSGDTTEENQSETTPRICNNSEMNQDNIATKEDDERVRAFTEENPDHELNVDPINSAPSYSSEEFIEEEDANLTPEFPLSPESEGSYDLEETIDIMETIEEEQAKDENGQPPKEVVFRKINDSEDEESVYVSKEEALLQNGNSFEMGTLKSQIMQLEIQLAQRETQLESKATQMNQMLDMHQKEMKSFETKVKETKEEAKKRITKAKEKVDDMKSKMAEANARAQSAGSASQDKEGIVAALREEGEMLARKQSEMEHSVREARLDMRDLKKDLASEKTAKEKAEAKVIELESELKETKTDLSAAKQKGGLADKLDSDLLAAKEEREKNASIILGLEAKLKESKSRNIELQKDMEEAFKEKVSQLEQDSTSIRNEKDAILHDLESKLRTSEREANMREDSLRHEVSELRKRWQDAVRRCDALSIDLQQSSAPLMRQLESTERQNRARAAAWAELESKLRSDLEENIIENEKLSKQKIEMEAELKKSSRYLKGMESDLIVQKNRVEDLTSNLLEANTKYENTTAEFDIIKVDFENLEQMLKENEANQNRERMNAIQETEERCNDHIESLEVELRQERDKRLSLEKEIQGMMDITNSNGDITGNMVTSNTATKKTYRNLASKTNQVDILQDTLLGLGASNGEDISLTDMHPNTPEHQSSSSNSNASESFAFIEQLSQALKAAKSERDTLRQQLVESEERRSVLENECVSNQEAIKALPSLEAKVSLLTRETAQKDMEIQALQEDINEVRDMYRSQLTALLGGGDDSHGTSLSQANLNDHNHSRKISATNGDKPVVPTSFGGMRTF